MTAKTLRNAHERIAILNACALENYGYVMHDNTILSKTNRGLLETVQLAPRKFSHTLVDYDNVPVRLIVDAWL